MRYVDLMPWLFVGHQLIYASVLMGLAGYFFFGLARFLVLFPRPLDTWTIVDGLPLGSRLRRAAGKDGVLPSVQRWHQSLLSGRALWIGALLGALILPLSGAASRYSPSGLGGGIAFVIVATGFILFLFGMWFALASMLHLNRFGTSEERRRTVWLRGVVLAVLLPLGLTVLLIFTPRDVLKWLAGPHLVEIATAGLVYVMLLPQIIALALSSAVIQRGVLDPRAGFTRFTIWTVLGLLLTVMFVLVERVVALKIVAWLQLPAESGAVVAGAIIAATFVPLRAAVSRQVHRLAERWLPLSIVAQGEQVERTVAITDLSGYTALAARDGEQSRLQSAALKRAAELAINAHGGRLVKSLGDAVMLTFERPAQAVAVVKKIHADFPGMAAALGYEPLPLHSALHAGEIVEAHDGDIFGHPVNVTARLVDAAKAGEIVLSGAVLAATGMASEVEDIGERRFKNVPEPVRCFRLTEAGPVGEPASA
jgi:adenylate cyclase